MFRSNLFHSKMKCTIGFKMGNRHVEEEVRYFRINNLVKIKSLTLTQCINLDVCSVYRDGCYETYYDKKLGVTLKFHNNSIPIESQDIR